MSQAADYSHILAAALALPSEDRQSLAGELHASLQAELRGAVGEARLAEIAERIRRYRDGSTNSSTLDELSAEVARRRSP